MKIVPQTLDNFTTRRLGRSLTEYKHPQFNDLVLECTGFVTMPVGASDMAKYPIQFEPKCGDQECCYGILKDSDVRVKLMCIIDSSD